MVFRSIGVLALGMAMGAGHGGTVPSAGLAKASSAGAVPALLPKAFAGWSQHGAEVATPDAKDAAAWQEFGFARGEQAKYTHGGAAVAVEAFQFADATGAYGAFTLMQAAGMQPVRVGSERFAEAANKPGNPGNPGARPQLEIPPTFYNGAREGDEWLLRKGNLVIAASFAHGVGGEKAVLMQLDMALPRTPGPSGILPSLPDHLPPDGLERATLRYAIGPAAYQREGGVLPPELIHFDQDAEVVTAQYGKGTLTLLSYPTPQIADARMAALAGALQKGAVPGTPGALLVKRAGTMVALTSGGFTPEQAKALLKQIEFRENVSIDRLRPKLSEVQKTAKVLTSIALLTMILGGASILLGLFLGGGRAVYRVMRGKPASSLGEEEFISLNLEK